MDFFASQDRARKQTQFMLLLFVLAVIAIVLTINLAMAIGYLAATHWPADLHTAMGEHVYLIAGGHEYDGRVLTPLDEAASCVRRAGNVAEPGADPLSAARRGRAVDVECAFGDPDGRAADPHGR